MMSNPTAATVLREAGLRVTAPRLAVLTALAAGLPHAGAEVIAAAVRGSIGEISAQTVYNVLNAFVEAGLLRRIEPAASPGLYELRVGDNHHHVVCRRCGGTSDVDCVIGAAPCLEGANLHGFLIDEAEITFWGLCPTCQVEVNGGHSSD